MVRVRLISKEEAQTTRKQREPGPRRQRMQQFDEYARTVVEHPEEAAVFEELGEEPQKFVLSLRGALKRAGVEAVVRKMRGRDEVRVWIAEARAAAQQSGAARGRRGGAVRGRQPAGRAGR